MTDKGCLDNKKMYMSARRRSFLGLVVVLTCVGAALGIREFLAFVVKGQEYGRIVSFRSCLMRYVNDAGRLPDIESVQTGDVENRHCWRDLLRPCLMEYGSMDDQMQTHLRRFVALRFREDPWSNGSSNGDSFETFWNQAIVCHVKTAIDDGQCEELWVDETTGVVVQIVVGERQAVDIRGDYIIRLNGDVERVPELANGVDVVRFLKSRAGPGVSKDAGKDVPGGRNGVGSRFY
jgi:hypothetical protein